MNDFLEDLLWTSYRYCIGRHSYVCSYAFNMADYFYDRLSDDHKIHYAKDIRDCIAECLERSSFNFTYDWTVPNKRPLEDFIECLNSLEDVSNITHIEAYIEDGKMNYSICRTSSHPDMWDIIDLLPWMDLASLFDVSNHKLVTCDNGETIRVYESYVQRREECEESGNLVFGKPIAWKYDKVYRPVNDKLSNITINPKHIINVQSIN